MDINLNLLQLIIRFLMKYILIKIFLWKALQKKVSIKYNKIRIKIKNPCLRNENAIANFKFKICLEKRSF